MNGLRALIVAVNWLRKRNWGLAFLLAFVSFALLGFFLVQNPSGKIGVLMSGWVYRAGFYVGSRIFPNYNVPGTNGFYLVPLFGAAANFLVLTGFWLPIVSLAQRNRTATPDDFPRASEFDSADKHL
jgi:hypothetical protein